MKKINFTKEQKEKLVTDVQQYFMSERDEEIGNLSAELLLQFMIEKVGPTIYNQGIRDAHAFMSKKLEDVYGLEK